MMRNNNSSGGYGFSGRHPGGSGYGFSSHGQFNNGLSRNQNGICQGNKGRGQGGRDYCRCNPDRPSIRTLRNGMYMADKNETVKEKGIDELGNEVKNLEEQLKIINEYLEKMKETNKC